MRTRSWPHILLNNGPGEVLSHTNRRWIGWCADLKLKTSRDSSYFMDLCQVCRCFHVFSVFPVFSSVFNKTISKQPHTSSSFFWPVPSAPSWQRSNNVRRWSTRPWHLMGNFGDIFLGCLKQQQFPPLWPVFNSIRKTWRWSILCRPKQEKLQTVRWRLPWRRKSLQKYSWMKPWRKCFDGRKYGGKKPMKNMFIYRIYIYISQKFNMFQWFNLMRFGTSRCQQYALGIAVGGFHGGSGGEQLLVQSYNLMSVTWRINLKPFYMWLMWPFGIFP